jgi:YfiH family protein
VKLSEQIAVDLPGARALFTTRRGGVSSGRYESLNLGRWTEDRPEDVEQNRALLEQSVGAKLAYGRQVHGPLVRRVRDGVDEIEEADGQATALAGVAPMVLVADCLPIALAGGGVVAMLHAGWRGLESGVIAEGVRAMRELGARGRVDAAIGPGAGPCCYEVGEAVHGAFSTLDVDARRGRNLDLKAIARAQLERAGVGGVQDCEVCTICGRSELFFSHRRDGGATGRQAGVVWLT